MSGDVIKFAPRPAAPLKLPPEFVELRLAADCSIAMTLYDRDYNVVAVLDFALSSKPEDFAPHGPNGGAIRGWHRDHRFKCRC
jgi:hypothetical protein